jgi:2,5-diketo-D-gluconate reductase A
LSQKYRKTPAQIVLRWQIQAGNSAIPKSVRPERIVENISIFDFGLTADEATSIEALDTGKRGGLDPLQLTQELFNLVAED